MEEKFPGYPVWQKMAYYSNEGTHHGVFEYYETPMFEHIFLVNDPPGEISKLQPEVIWRRQHNLRAYEYLRNRLRTANVPVNDSFCLPRELARGLAYHLPTFTEDFKPESMEIVLQRRRGQGACLVPRTQPSQKSAEVKPTAYKLLDVQFVDERPLITDTLKGRISQVDPKRYFFKVELPGVPSIKNVAIKRVRKKVPRHFVQVTAGRLALENEDESKLMLSTFIAYFDKNGETFSMEKSTEEIMKEAKLVDGVLTFWLDKERDDQKDDLGN